MLAEGRFTYRDGLAGWLEAKGRRAPLYGSGSVEVGPTEVTLRGWRRTWLGAPEQAEILVPTTRIRNVLQDGTRVLFEYKSARGLLRRVEFATTSAQAQSLVESLPLQRDAQSERKWADLREFNRRIDALCRVAWVTPALIAINVAIFAAMVFIDPGLRDSDPQGYLQWGANFGPLTLNGQWWRLLTALFVHVNAVHLALNMWALWNVGRLCERLYGRWLMLFVYLASGLVASLTSLLWNSHVVSCGASGAIFGMLGAFLAFLAHRRHEVPAAVARAHWVSTAVFVAYNLFFGALQTPIDNAAHVGGLVAGFALGWVLARPLDEASRQELPFKQALAALVITAATMVAGVWEAHGFPTQRTAADKYMRAHPWFAVAEEQNLRLWQELANRYQHGDLGAKELANRVELEVLPFWAQTNTRLRKELPTLAPGQRAFGRLFVDVAQARVEWARAIVTATRTGQATLMQDIPKFAQRTDDAVARVAYASLQATIQYGPRPLADSQWATTLRRLLSASGRQCIVAPVALNWRTAATDSRTDGPALADAAGCKAQQLFLAGSYSTLDRWLEHARVDLGDLPDGNSTLGALLSGLDNLFRYGNLDPLQALERTADWRNAVPDSVEPDLIEVLIFESWAWSARGFGTWHSVAPEARVLFTQREALAAVGLEATAARARDNPLWYELSLTVGRDRSIGKDKLRTVLDAGIARTPKYLPLYRNLLSSLMPRWGGSYDEVDEFINEMTNKPGGRDVEMYARLYWIYARLERDDINLFEASHAAWPTMKRGFQALTQHYPNSDYVLNAFARFACLDGDGTQYRELRPLLDKRASAPAWSEKTSIESCDKQLRAAQPTSHTQARMGRP